MRPIWVLVANNSQADMYDFQPYKHQLNLMDSINHQEGRWHNGDFISDKRGNATSMHSHTFSGMGRSGLGDTNKSPKTIENARFTRMVAKAINSAYQSHSFDSLQVCAPPKFMGELLTHLKKEIPVHKVTKDLVSSDAGKIMSHLNPLTLDLK